MLIGVICTGYEALTGNLVNTSLSRVTQKLEDAELAARCGISANG